MGPPFSFLKAQNYNDAEMESLMEFFSQSSNWQTAGLIDPSNSTPIEKMDYLVDEGVIAIENSHVKEIKLNKSYQGQLTLADFKQLTLLEVKGTNINSFSIKNCSMENILLEANKSLKTIRIEDCAGLIKILVTPDPDLGSLESMALESVSVLDCEKLTFLDLSGKNDRPVVDESFYFNRNISELSIKNCPSLIDINCMATGIGSIDIDTPENIKRINAWQAFPISDFTSFTNLEELFFTLADESYKAKLPLCIKTLISPFGGIQHLDLSFLTSLEELYLYGSDVVTLNPPSSLDIKKTDLRYNRFTNKELKKLVGNMTNETFGSHEIFPQRLNRNIQITGSDQYPEIAGLGEKMDLSTETYGGVESIFKWYKMSDNFQAELYSKKNFTQGSFYSMVEDAIDDDLQLISDGPIFTPGEDMSMNYFICIIEPEGYDGWNKVDPRRYYSYKAVPYPTLEFYLTINGKSSKVDNGKAFKIEEGLSEAYLEIKWNEDYTNPYEFNDMHIYGSINGVDFNAFDKHIYCTKKINLSLLGKGIYNIKIDSAIFFNNEPAYCQKNYNDSCIIQIGEEDPIKPSTPPIRLDTVVVTIVLDDPSLASHINTYPAVGEYEVERGSQMTQLVFLSDVCDQSDINLYANNMLILSEEEQLSQRATAYTYQIPISGKTEICITGVTRNNPTKISKPAEKGVKIWTSPGYIHVSQNTVTNKQNKIRIYTMMGQLVKQQLISEGITIIPLQKGVYLVVIEDMVAKIIING